MDSRSCFNMTYFQQCKFAVFVERTQQEHEGRILMHKKPGCCYGVIKKERQGRKRFLSWLEGLAQFNLYLHICDGVRSNIPGSEIFSTRVQGVCIAICQARMWT
ncbi:hypothetical protein O6H91_05G095800 [Diphasiastrum complanatum]|uniref:Uncharacterized protein n=1 Tax=Diphasiastrum complanatum TaxID=34168 RepID=A0ACC2DRD3_DIPCM|nr:hypothetical protein O6H91_05G095800 [Diphasiastrum complanatum]